MKRWAVLIICTIIAAVFAGGWTVKKTSSEPDDGLSKIVAFADAHLTDGWHLTVRASAAAGAYHSTEEMAQLGKQIAQGLGINETGQLDLSGTSPVYRVQTDDPELGHISVIAAGSGNRDSRFVIVRLDTMSDRDEQLLAAWRIKTQSVFHDIGIEPEWNVIAQGELRPSGSPSPSSYESPKQAIADAANHFGAVERERYTDSGTVSISYDAPSLRTSVRSGGHRISLQTALHQDSISGRWRMTIGTPVITTEY